MRLVVLSDSHRRVSTMLDIIEKHIHTADYFIFLGDMDNDFDEVISLYPNLKYFRVAGNNDYSSQHPLSMEIRLANKLIYICHGHTHYVKHGYGEIISHAKKINADICLFGHTHTQYNDYINSLYIMNPGAVCNGEYALIDIVDKGIMLIPQEI